MCINDRLVVLSFLNSNSREKINILWYDKTFWKKSLKNILLKLLFNFPVVLSVAYSLNVLQILMAVFAEKKILISIHIMHNINYLDGLPIFKLNEQKARNGNVHFHDERLLHFFYCFDTNFVTYFFCIFMHHFINCWRLDEKFFLRKIIAFKFKYTVRSMRTIFLNLDNIS